MLLIRYLKALSKREKFLYVAFGRVAIVICSPELFGDGCTTWAISYSVRLARTWAMVTLGGLLRPNRTEHNKRTQKRGGGFIEHSGHL